MRRNKTLHKKSHLVENDFGARNLAIGALAGGLLGIGAALFFASKRKTSLTDDLAETYNNAKCRAGSYVNDVLSKGGEACENVTDYANCLKDSASDYVHDLKEKASDFIEDTFDNPNYARILLVGTIATGVLGAAYYLSTSDNKFNSAEIGRKIRRVKKSLNASSSFDWLAVAGDLLDTINSKVNRGKEDFENGYSGESEDHYKSSPHNRLDDVIELAGTGLRLWQNFQARR